MSRSDLDELDFKIIARLGRNARVSNREIARELELTEGTIRARLKKLTDRKIIRVTAVTNINRLRNPVLAYLWIEIETSHQRTTVMKALADLPEITFVASLLGRADLLAMTLVQDGGHLTRYLHQTVDQIPGIRRVQYSLAHHFLKHDSRFGAVLS
jgi:Lrp/AsnC family transcriptional regulator, regulator for asnA, asnC and gidA